MKDTDRNIQIWKLVVEENIKNSWSQILLSQPHEKPCNSKCNKLRLLKLQIELTSMLFQEQIFGT